MNKIILDTNCLFKSDYYSYNSFDLNKNYYDIQKFIETENLTNSCELLIPKIVIDELKMQQIQNYLNDKDSLEGLLRKFGEFTKPHELMGLEQYSLFLDKIVSDFLIKNISVIELCSNFSLPQIVRRAIYKKPPFSGNKGQTDKGFKDTIIWESVIEYANKNEGIYYFITNDKIFNGETKTNLTEEFIKKTNQRIYFVTDIESLRFQISGNLGQTAISDKYFMRKKELKREGCLDKFFNGLEAFCDDLKIDGKVYSQRFINYNISQFIISEMTENNCVVHVEGEIGTYDFDHTFRVRFELELEKEGMKWNVTEYKIIPEVTTIKEMELDVSR